MHSGGQFGHDQVVGAHSGRRRRCGTIGGIPRTAAGRTLIVVFATIANTVRSFAPLMDRTAKNGAIHHDFEYNAHDSRLGFETGTICHFFFLFF